MLRKLSVCMAILLQQLYRRFFHTFYAEKGLKPYSTWTTLFHLRTVTTTYLELLIKATIIKSLRWCDDQNIFMVIILFLLVKHFVEKNCYFSSHWRNLFKLKQRWFRVLSFSAVVLKLRLLYGWTRKNYGRKPHKCNEQTQMQWSDSNASYFSWKTSWWKEGGPKIIGDPITALGWEWGFQKRNYDIDDNQCDQIWRFIGLWASF